MGQLRPIFFDLETTGTFPQKDRIVEIAALDPVNNTSFQRLVNPGIRIPEDVIKIHGITNEMVQEAPPFAVVARDFLAFTAGNVVMVAHNGELFDLPFLQAEFKRHSVSFSPEWIFVDSLKWARKYRKDLPRHALQFLRQQFSIPANTAHRALDDVIVLHEVFKLLTDDLSCEEVLQRIEGIKITPSVAKAKEEVCALELF